MKKSHYLALLSTAFCYAPIFAQTNSAVSTDNTLKTKLDSVVDYAVRIYLEDSNTNGVSIGIINKKQSHSYNYGKISQATANDFYNIGSVAKIFVTTILAQAVIDKKANLNDDIRKFLPGSYPNLQYRGEPIRLVNLANHTSGLPTTFKTFSPAIKDSLKKLDIKQQLHFYALYSADHLLTDLHSVSIDTIPGTKYQYNSSAMKLLELLLERIYHKPYEEIVTTYLQTHLNMFNTKPYLTDVEIKRAVQGYNNNQKPQPFLNLTGYYFGPTMNTTINDMLTFLNANLSRTDKAINLTHKITYKKDNGLALGLGWMIANDNKGERYIYHDGNTKIGYNTLCIFYPKSMLGFIIIANDTVSQERVAQIENTIKTMLNDD
ncbi:serine hydrolase domain-containing protein [Flavobacterium poyangense]|uniref:serine hydrolase domain-containing protein n=1 Tax=Flavobacterium poyangense TaxID=2204302 RepID=UPI001423714F|nr:serine hydrolase domain-containing protein [Flavobacterium sp. JXAS1]